MRRHVIALLLPLFCLTATSAALAETSSSSQLTLTQIMANPDWIALTPENPYWNADSKTVYFWQRAHQAPTASLHAVNLASGKVSAVPDSDWSATGSTQSVFNYSRTRELYVNHGDLFIKDVKNGRIGQLTRGLGQISDPQFVWGRKAVSYSLNHRYYVLDLATGLSTLAADVKAETAPDDVQTPYHYYSAEQARLFAAVNKMKSDKNALQEQQKTLTQADSSRGPEPFYLGSDVKIVNQSLSPNAKWMLVVTEPKNYNAGPHGQMPDYITEDGRIVLKPEHRRVGWNKPAPMQAVLLDLTQHKQYPLDLKQLPGITDDPLAALRKQAVAWDVKHGVSKTQAEASVKAPAVRPVQVWGLAWSNDGGHLAIMFRSIDNKDRWIATIDFDHGMKLVTRNRLTDPAWINWNFNDFGWLPDNHTLWYLSEKTNYSQIYTDDVDTGKTRQWTQGHFEVYHPVPGTHGRYIYYRANKVSPGIYSLYRLNLSNDKSVALTHLGGMNGSQLSMLEGGDSRFKLSPNGQSILFYHSTMLRPPELYVVSTTPGGTPQRLTHTIKSGFTSINWIMPKIVHVPSTHFDGTIQARLYLPHDYDPSKSYAGVAFIHGAGYLQEAYQGWSFYFHEMMFNNFLAQHGYVVIDMDYRGSQGYGRDWRTAIYQHMGHPEVQDITDGMHWLEKNYHVDPNRLGVYGGSYGGFMTYMMMFRRPNLFQAGAALRPVADWANYNDLYTSDILNRPAIDPEAYDISSPIHYAQNLKGHLLISQGVEDNNVFFQDTVHMVQKLIELKNPNFQVAIYPMEHHGFEAPIAWLDEYRRVWKLFCTYVSPKRDCQTDK
ncbi:MAG: prolyl oligopeptidase family serine peptidase [Gammaproteobacteria bacterium]